jgi:hypothetical protein
VFDAFDDSRLVRRRVFVCPEAAVPKALDTGLRTVLAVETIRGLR